MRDRRGAAVVEFALVCPLLVLLVFSSLELGRAVMVQHMLEEAALAGCRVATLDGAKEKDVKDVVAEAMQKANISGYKVKVDPKPNQANLQDPVTVEVSVDYDKVSWMMLSRFMGGTKLTGRCVLPVVENSASKAKKKAKTKKKAKKKARRKMRAKYKLKKK